MKWLQRLINERPDLINERLALPLGCLPDGVQWTSPLAGDEFAEYSDRCAMERLSANLAAHSLESFWPDGGPQWDALAVAGQSPGKQISVEAKSHICEVCGSACQAGLESPRLIEASLAASRSFLGSSTRINWSKSYYQHANRLAHLYLLRELNGLDAYMVFLYFLNDEEMGGPRTIDEWKTVIELVERSLGVHNHPFLQFAPAVFVDVNDLR